MFLVPRQRQCWLIASLTVVLASVFAGASLAPAASRAPAGARTPVILISVDTLRADHLSCYGYKALRTPHIDSLAQGGTIFSEISSQVPITLPSHVSMFTSSYPFMTGIEENGEILPPGAVTLASVLKGRGYHTAAFIGGYFLERRFGLDQGFDVYDSPFDSRPLGRAVDLKRSAAEVTASARMWLEAHSTQPFFVFVHLFDLHMPYDPPKRFESLAPKSEYDAELAYVDDALGKFFRFLSEKKIYQRSLVVLLADHGESLGEHGERTHGYFVYQSTLHVPLIIHWPAKRPGPTAGRSAGMLAQPSYPERVDWAAGLIDVAPTVLQELGIPAPVSFAGHSLTETLPTGAAASHEVYSESVYAHDKFGWAPLGSLRVGDYQYIEAPKPELYNLRHDSSELHNLYSAPLAASYRERLNALRARYRAQNRHAGSGLRPDVLESLGSLGYVAVSSSHGADDSVDPKDHLTEYIQYLEAIRLAQTGKLRESVAIFEEILGEDPGNVPSHYELARSEAALGRYYDAVSQLKSALAFDPGNVPAEELLGKLWLQLGQEGRAEAEFQHLLSLTHGDYTAEYGLGLIAASQRKFDVAIRDFRAALVQDPKSAVAHYQLGLVLEVEGRKQEAVQEFREALERDPGLNGARNALAQLGGKPGT